MSRFLNRLCLRPNNENVQRSTRTSCTSLVYSSASSFAGSTQFKWMLPSPTWPNPTTTAYDVAYKAVNNTDTLHIKQ